jgi:hypothetical protein
LISDKGFLSAVIIPYSFFFFRMNVGCPLTLFAWTSAKAMT